jgi:hypothetical protein
MPFTTQDAIHFVIALGSQFSLYFGCLSVCAVVVMQIGPSDCGCERAFECTFLHLIVIKLAHTACQAMALFNIASSLHVL